MFTDEDENLILIPRKIHCNWNSAMVSTPVKIGETACKLVNLLPPRILTMDTLDTLPKKNCPPLANEFEGQLLGLLLKNVW